MPQNIQKRLLLYVLQQLSLFSEIDLPNLEQVSLNNIHLKDVPIDVEKVGSIPGCSLRFGKVGSLELNGGVMGGVNIDMNNIELVVAPNFDTVNEDTNSLVLFLLAQSTADLANTIMLDKEEDNSILVEDDEEPAEVLKKSRTNSTSSNASVKSRPSALTGVMNRAVEIALLRLQIKITNMSIKIVSELTDVLVTVDECLFKTNNGTRFVLIKGIKVICLKPDINPGDSDKKEEGQQQEEKEEDEEEEGDDDEDDDKDDGYGDESLMDSMVFTHDEASSIYMSATSQSFDKSLKKDGNGDGNVDNMDFKEKSLDEYPILFCINSVDIEFEGLANITNLCVDIDDIKVAAVPLTPTLSSIFTSISRSLKLKNHQLRKHNVSTRKFKSNSKFPQYDETDDMTYDDDDVLPEDEDATYVPLLNRLHVANIIISATSALLPTGEFASTTNNITFNFQNLNVKQKNDRLIYGGIEVFKILNLGETTTEVFKFEPVKSTPKPSPGPGDASSEGSTPVPSSAATPKADIRFEVFKTKEEQSTKTEVTTLFLKPASVVIDSSTLQILTNFSVACSTLSENYTLMKNNFTIFRENQSSQPKKLKPIDMDRSSSQFVLQTASISANIILEEDYKVKVVVFPVSFNLLQNQMVIQKILVSSVSSTEESVLLTLSGIHLELKPQEFKSFLYRVNNSLPREVSLIASSSLIVESVSGSTSFSNLKRLSKSISLFINLVNDRACQVNSLEKSLTSLVMFKSPALSPTIPQSTSLHSSIYSNQRRTTRRQGNAFNNTSILVNSNRTSNPSFRILVKKVEFEVTSITSEFGNMRLNLHQIVFHKVNNNFQGYVLSLNLNRWYGDNNNVVDEFINDYQKRDLSSIKTPSIIVQMKTNEKSKVMDIILRDFIIENYTKWLPLFEDIDKSAEPSNETPVEVKKSSKSTTNSERLDIRFILHDFAVGFNPGRLPSKLLLVFSKGNFDLTFGTNQFYVKSSLREITLLLVDDIKYIKAAEHEKSKAPKGYISPVAWLKNIGFHPVGSVNCTHIGITVNTDIESIKKRNERLGIQGDLSLLDVKVNSDEHQLDLCADSAYVLIQIINDLKIPVIFSDAERFRVTVDNEVNLLDSLDLQEFSYRSKDNPLSNSFKSVTSSGKNDGDLQLDIVDEYYAQPHSSSQSLDKNTDGKSNSIASSVSDPKSSQSLSFEDEHFANNVQNHGIVIHPVKVNVNLSKTRIYLYDGYDWKQTRKAIKGAVKRVEMRALKELEKKKRLAQEKEEAAQRKRDALNGISTDRSPNTRATVVKFAENHATADVHSLDDVDIDDDLEDDDEEEEATDEENIEEVLFSSLHITLPKGTNSKTLTDNINKGVSNGPIEEANLDPVSQVNVDVGKNYKNLRLRRPKDHKVMVDIKNLEVNATIITTRDPRKEKADPNKEIEVVNAIELKIDTFDVIDNVPTSTWNKFLTYMNSLGEREIGTSMLKLSLMNVRPDVNLCATEIIMDVQILPIRLHIDQDTLDYITRFTQFKDTRFDLPVDDIVYLEKFLISPIKLKLDYKPKKVDYAGIRSGNHAEFMNFFILDGSVMTLPKVTLHGILGFPKLGEELANVWAPEVQQTQLAGILSGLSPIRSIVNIGGGVKDLVAIPIQEYKKDGRLMRSLQKGTKSFAKTTGYELLKLGVKLASGTQVLLEQGEEFLGGEGSATRLPKRRSSHGEGAEKDKKTKNHNARMKYGDLVPDDSGDEKYPLKQGAPSLLASSQLLNERIGLGNDRFGGKKLYSYIELDENQDIDEQILNSSSILLLDPHDKRLQTKLGKRKKHKEVLSNEDFEYIGEDGGEGFSEPEDSDEEGELGVLNRIKRLELDEEQQEKLISLYSNQPETVQQGLKSAYKSLGRNFASTKRTLVKLKKEIDESESFQESLVSVIKSSPVILIRPIIGTTEAVLQTLMGLGNQIDSKHLIEAKDKYGTNNSNSGDE